MKWMIVFLWMLICASANAAGKDSSYYSAQHPLLQYTGRVHTADKMGPVIWAPGAYIELAFEGSYCVMLINDEMRYGIHHNFLVIQVDGATPYRIQLTEKNNRVVIAQNLNSRQRHRVLICKATEAEIGYLQPTAFIVKNMVALPPKPKRKMEFIGDSITCGMGNDSTALPCGQGAWYSQHNAWLAYGPLTARALKAQWHLSAISGIGLVHSCCNKTTVMPPLFKKLSLSADTLQWNFKLYQPDVVSICLGENDGLQDSALFCNAYLQFLQSLRAYYPKATFIMLSSPMAGNETRAFQQKMLQRIAQAWLANDNKIGYFIFKRRYVGGCSYHPSAAEHVQIAAELTSYLQKRMKWK